MSASMFSAGTTGWLRHAGASSRRVLSARSNYRSISCYPYPRASTAPEGVQRELVTRRQLLLFMCHYPDDRNLQRAMTRRTIHFSDLSSQPILDDADVVRVVVIDHPALDGDAVEFEAAASELTDIVKGAHD